MIRGKSTSKRQSTTVRFIKPTKLIAIIHLTLSRTRRPIPPDLPVEQSQVPGGQIDSRPNRLSAEGATSVGQRREGQIRAIQQPEDEPSGVGAAPNGQPGVAQPDIDRAAVGAGAQLGVPGDAPGRGAGEPDARLPARVRDARAVRGAALVRRDRPRRRVRPLRRHHLQEELRRVYPQGPREALDAPRL